MADEYIAKITTMLNDAKFGMLTTHVGNKLVSRPMGLQHIEFDGDIWFFTFEDSNKVQQIRNNPSVNLAIDESGNSWLSIAGTAEVVHDRQKAEELWTAPLKAWFTDGLETEGLTLIKVHAESIEYWDAPNSKVVQLFGMAKAALGGKPADVGENESIRLT